MTQSSHILEQILTKAELLRQKSHKTLAVFDLDSTLFDVSPRLLQILKDFAAHPEHVKKFPDQIHYFQNIQTDPKDWGIQAALKRAGLKDDHLEFRQTVKNFWLKNFFSNEYLKYDQPYPGAIEFVNRMSSLDVHIVYLTGRDQHRMGEGSAEVLKKWGFPLQAPQSDLVLKPHKDLNDAEFKKDWFLSQKNFDYAHIWFFENEPVNVNLIHNHCPQIEIIFLDTTHAGHAEPPPHLTKISHFLRSS